MGLLDQVIGGVLGNVLGGGQGPSSGQSRGGGGLGGGLGGALGNAASSPLVKALLLLLAAKAASGGFGDILGSGSRGGTPDRGPPPGAPSQGGGFGSDSPFHQNASPQAGGGGSYGDLSGYLDKPGGQAQGGAPDASSPGGGLAGAGAGGALGGGLGSLIESFQRNGYGDVIESWIGHGENRQVQPNHLGDALGSDTVDQLSRQTGMNRDDLLSQLSGALPGVIDKLTPQGRPPSGEEQRHW